MHSRILLWSVLILLGSISISQCNRTDDDDDDDDEFDLDDKRSYPATYHKQHIDYLALLKRKLGQNRGGMKRTCTEIVNNRHFPIENGFPAKIVSNVRECMAYCDSIPGCLGWDYYAEKYNTIPAHSCNPKGPERPTSATRNNVLSGYCDLTQDTCAVAEPCNSACSRPANPKSTSARTSVSISFVNCGTADVTIWWYDYSGAPKKLATIAPKESHIQATYVTHPWTARLSSNTNAVQTINGCSLFYPQFDDQEALIGRSCVSY